MAWEIPYGKATYRAHADLRLCQFHYVKFTAATNDEVELCSAATDIPCGILQNAPNTGEPAEVMHIGISKVRVGAGGAIAAGNLVGTDAAGHCDPKIAGVDVTEYIVGQCIEGAAANAIGTVTINGLNPCRGA